MKILNKSIALLILILTLLLSACASAASVSWNVVAEEAPKK